MSLLQRVGDLRKPRKRDVPYDAPCSCWSIRCGIKAHAQYLSLQTLVWRLPYLQMWHFFPCVQHRIHYNPQILFCIILPWSPHLNYVYMSLENSSIPPFVSYSAVMKFHYFLSHFTLLSCCNIVSFPVKVWPSSMKTWNVLPYLCWALVENIRLLILQVNPKFTDLI